MKDSIIVDGVKFVPEGTQSKANVKLQKGLTYCIIRTYSAGVFAGWIDRKVKGQSRTIFNARRLWYWKTTGLDVSTISEKGVISSECKFSEVKAEIDLENVVEVQPCTEQSKKSIELVKVYENK